MPRARLYLRLDDSKIIESEEVSPGVVLDFNESNQVVGIEILNLSKRPPEAHAQSGFARVPIPDRLTGKQKPLAREIPGKFRDYSFWAVFSFDAFGRAGFFNYKLPITNYELRIMGGER